MKKTIVVITLVMAFLLVACGQSNTPDAIPTISLDGGQPSSSNAPQTSSGDSISASAIIVPQSDAHLSFPSVGQVTSVNVEVGDAVKAGDVLVELDTSILEAKVREAEANLAYAEIELKYLIRVSGCKVGCAPSQQHIEVAENDIAHAQALVDSAKAVLESQSNLTAPFDGVVVSVDVSPGETVTPGQVVIVMGDLSRYRVETTDLSERDVTKVEVGQDVNIFVEALNQNFAGKVADVSRSSTTLGGDVVYKVTIDFDEQPDGLLWGMSADVEIVID